MYNYYNRMARDHFDKGSHSFIGIRLPTFQRVLIRFVLSSSPPDLSFITSLV